MRTACGFFFLLTIFLVSAQAQTDRGVDPQSNRIRNMGAERTPGHNGTNTDTGTGRGMDFGRGRERALAPVPNPYRFTVRRDTLLEAVQDLMRERRLVLDQDASRPDEGLLVSQPYTFSRGAVVTQNELNRYADAPVAATRGWTRGRYTLLVEVQPIDATNANVSVTARIEGRTDGITGAEWVTLRSTGVAEEEFLIALVERLTGAPPPGRAPQP